MPKFKIPYSTTFVELDIPEENFAGVLESKAHHYVPKFSETEIVEKALDNPIGSPSLEELVKGKKNMVIITSDHTRPVPSKITLPILLRRIRNANPDIDVTILIATGFHRATTHDEMIRKFGEEIVKNEKMVNHVCWDKDNMAYVGILPSGGELWLNKLAVETELLISEGFIEPHFFAGFSGGRKSILPGIAGEKTVLANHCSKFIASPFARTGILENNPIHKDMVYAAEKVGLAFILNVVIDAQKKIIHAVAGHPQKAHEEGCQFVKDLAVVEKVPADIVITSNGGYPLDQNIYQTVKGMTAAEASCKEGGVIIILSACNDGHGGESFYQYMANASSPKEVTEKVLQIPQDETIPDQWEFQILARILEKHTVFIVTDQCDKKMIENMHINHAYTIEEALEKAFQIKGKDASITVIPDGVSVIVK
ncbi:Nickel-dependent lactate racemase [Anaerobranca californiensis DSM 14826]|jgi:nickel-dependent lactate racemase|uniref:Nickel-dependent lactate racemase n=1 Tax=Anaerobranca californiensis DSM 14826 TaxID=1120989 RepID=A0A1M6NUW4_9FIRM|nr:nickel-dependent lactate racemase [Anaerobranca californiensis]SHJ99431.1 Nickel-dependent lactate racemase [Anaerobranca californiensis DSM 14826]